MIESVTPNSQVNFLPSNLLAGTEHFFNSKTFMPNEVQYLSTIISMDDRAQERGLDQIKDAINGLI